MRSTRKRYSAKPNPLRNTGFSTDVNIATFRWRWSKLFVRAEVLTKPLAKKEIDRI
jgi:hypothetical protein